MAGISDPTIPARFRVSQGSGYSQETTILNDYNGLTRRDRTNKKGKTSTRYTIQVSAEPLIQQFSAIELGKEPAAALAGLVKSQIEGVGVTVAPMTLRARQEAKDALQGTSETEPSAEVLAYYRARYTGGKIGAMPPTGGDQLFNDSGRLTQITLRANRAYTNDAVWEINVPKNRLDPSTWTGDLASFLKMVKRLQKEVPVLGNDRNAILGDKSFVQAVAAATDRIFAANDQRIAGLKSQLAAAQFDLAFQLARGAFPQLLSSQLPRMPF